MPTRFVLDASLFRKYSIGPSYSSKYCPIDVVYDSLDDEKRNLTTAREILSLLYILDKIINEKVKICINKEILNEYCKLLDKYPKEIHEYIWAIMSKRNCIDHLDSGLFTAEDYSEIKNTDLEKKGIYLDIASALPNKIIVSTKEDKENIYIMPPNDRILFRHEIYCRYAWEHWDEIKTY